MKHLLLILFHLAACLPLHLGAFGQDPGGVPGSTVWFKANAEVYFSGNPITSGDVDQWDNSASNNSFDELLQTVDAPVLFETGLNYNPYLYFDGLNDRMSASNVPADSLFSSEHNTMFQVIVPESRPGPSFYMGWESNAVGGRMVYLERTGNFLRTDVGSAILVGSSPTMGEVSLCRTVMDTSGISTGRNGLQEGSHTATSLNLVNNPGEFSMGSRPLSETFAEAQVAEVISFDATLGDSAIAQVESYLAIKYGITLDSTDGGFAGNYYSSQFDLLWDASTAAAYHNNVIGLGRDDDQALLQKQSHTSDDTTRIYIDSLTASNALNVGSISQNMSFVLVGDNQGRLCASGATSLEKPTDVYARLDREWRITKTNFEEALHLDLTLHSCAGLTNINVADLRLLVDDDGNFLDAGIYGALDGLSFSISGSVLTISGIDASIIPNNATRFFTLGSDSSNSPLPVSWVELQGQALSYQTVALHWTVEESNTTWAYEIERSADSESWEQIGHAVAALASNSLAHYQWTDGAANPQEIFYRIRQVDQQGKVVYSPILQVDFSPGVAGALNLYPNPSTEFLNLESKEELLHPPLLYDLTGKTLQPPWERLDSEGKQWRADVRQLSRGWYFLRHKNSWYKVFRR